eukprot:gene10852-11006_t
MRTPAAGEVTAPRASGHLEQLSQMLGVGMALLQQWVQADLTAMKQQLMHSGNVVAAQQSYGLDQGPWLQHLAQHLLQHNLHNMAEAYDQAFTSTTFDAISSMLKNNAGNIGTNDPFTEFMATAHGAAAQHE